ncbi:dynamin family protein [Geodermatophilus sp. SYSU D00691]
MPAPLELVDRALVLAKEGDRADLHRRLTLVRRRIEDPSVRVLVVGEPKRGKSSLVNALVGAPVCPVDEDVATRVPTVVRGGPQPRATLVHAPRAALADVPPGGVPDEELHRQDVPLQDLAGRLAAGPGAEGPTQVVQAEVELPRKLLAGGLQLVDTPGVGGVGAARVLGTLDLLPTADAVVVVTDASQEFTAPEMAFLRQAVALCPHVVCVVTKVDATPHWRRIVDLDRGHLQVQGLEIPVFPVSSPLAALAVRSNDRELYDESGLRPLTEHLLEQVVQRAADLAERSLVHDLTSVTQHLLVTLRAELAALETPAARDALVSELESARAAVEDLRRRSARWQILLNDGVTDLMADIDFDLRERTRVITREAETAIDARDPGPVWDEIADWLDERVAGAVADSFVWAEQRSQWLAARVVEQFAEDGGGLVPELSVGSPAETLDTLVDIPDIDSGDMTVRSRLLIGLRGSYTGVLMTGLVTSLAGMAILNPISLAAGVLLGRKAYKDDKEQRIQRRQAEAKTVVRRHLDEVVFQLGKQLKDRLRDVQRTLRDLITDTVDEMSQSLSDAVRAAQRDTSAASAEHNARIRSVRQQVDAVERLAHDVRRLAGEAGPAA